MTIVIAKGTDSGSDNEIRNEACHFRVSSWVVCRVLCAMVPIVAQATVINEKVLLLGINNIVFVTYCKIIQAFIMKY